MTDNTREGVQGTMWTLKLYRDDSTTPIVFEDVKHVFWTANNTVLTIAQYTDVASGAHHYVQWPRERFCWYRIGRPGPAMAAFNEGGGIGATVDDLGNGDGSP